jgi:trigger factor
VKTQVENVSDVKKVIHFEIPWEDVDKHIKDAVRIIMRSARIPGFRPGKAPETLVRSRYAQHIKDEVINHVIPEAYQKALEENKLDVISEPSLHDVMYAEGSPFLFKVTVETKPNIQLKNYKGVELDEKPIEVKDEEIEQVLKSHQEATAELVPQTDTPAANSHYINAHVKAVSNQGGKTQTMFDGRSTIELGAEENHPSFNEHLVGKKAGETVEFDVTYPEDSSEKSIAGKTIHYTVRIESVNEKRLTPIDDEFAKDLGEFKSLSELKEKISQDIMNHKKNQQRSEWKEELLKRLLDENQFEVPEGLVRKEAESLLNEYAYMMHRRGQDLKDPSLNWQEIQERLSKQAERNIRGSMILETIAADENVEVTDADVERSIQQLADQQRRAPEAVKAELIKEKRLDHLKNRVRMTKTMDLLLDQAKINQVK